ncbi:hypothetical protein IVB30_30440 [Bradyrhizobium sp. 200]|uniref:hypothetical protein n=1 Tax=Bradyrhizobium sp. 200 TaxID=2782665 RepID=UPI001FFE6ED4|nr:hypothetical protein [Bradyrhizobium sp. 200]UPJ47559.1 hypothetical protein IVB30_30440 [Bradyrhizobium sp. 200]
MLPGFRFLFTAIVLSMSILIFGLGAAALLRAAHEEFANLPARRAPPQPMFARQNDDEPPTLALLRVDPPVTGQPAGNAPAVAVPEAAIDVPATVAQTPDARPAEPEKLAALKPAEPMQTEATKPGEPATETGAETSPAPAPAAEAEAPVSNAEVKVAAIAATPEPAAPPEPAADISSSEANITAARIATLGGPAVIVDEKTAAKATDATTTEANTTETKPDQSAVRKRAAEKARERRRIAVRRARLAREAALAQQQLQANPFAQFPLARATR